MNKLILIFLLCFVFLQNTKAQTPDPIAPPTEVIIPQPAAPHPVTVDEDQIFTKCEIPPSFPGGEKAWQKYFTENLHTMSPLNCGSGNYDIVIRFIVDKQGYASDFSAETITGCGLEKEAIKFLQAIPKWEPAKQNGTIVKAYTRVEVPLVVN